MEAKTMLVWTGPEPELCSTMNPVHTLSTVTHHNYGKASITSLTTRPVTAWRCLDGREACFEVETTETVTSRPQQVGPSSLTSRNTNPLQPDLHSTRAWCDPCNPRKAASPDGVSKWLLKECVHQFSEVFTKIFSLSLSIPVIPSYL